MDGGEEASLQFLDSSRFWIQKVFVPLLVCIGVGGNTVTVMVLTRRRMRCSTNIYLTALAIADIIYLLFVFFLSFATYKHIHDRKYELYWRFFGLTHWLCDAASSTSVWLTVSFTLERYIAVCHPMRGKTLCTENRAKSIIVIVAIFCLLTTASTTFEHELNLQEECLRNCTSEELKLKRLQQNPPTSNSLKNSSTSYAAIHYLPNRTIIVSGLDSNSTPRGIDDVLKAIASNCSTEHPHVIFLPHPDDAVNGKTTNRFDVDRVDKQGSNRESSFAANFTEAIEEDVELNDTLCCVKKLTVSPTATTLGKNTTYLTFMYWYSAIWFGLVPLVIIASLNCFLVRAVYESQKRRQDMTSTRSRVKFSLSNENRITVMLIGVVILFLICQTPTASFLIYKYFHEAHDKATQHLYLALGNIFNSLVTANASCNFLLYCVLSKKFRVTFRTLFCERRRPRSDTLVLSATSTRSSNKFGGAIKNGLRRNAHCSEYRTPRNLETQSLTSIPRSKSLMVRAPGKAKSTDLIL